MSSLVETQPITLSEFEPASPYPEQVDDRPQVNLLAIAWRSRWLILLSMLVGGGAAWIILQRVAPRYTSVSRVYVERSLPQLLSSQMQFGQSASYLYTQAELICSTPVLAAAANAPENANLESFRDVDNRVAFLSETIEAVVGREDDIINVMAELPNAQDAAQLINSVVDAYITKYAEERRTDTVEVLNILRNEKQRRDTELEDRRLALQEFRQQHSVLAVQVGNENVVTKQFAVLAEELGKTEIALLEAKARYNRLQKMYDTPSLRPMLLESVGSQQYAMGDVRLEHQLQINLENQVQDLEMRLTSERIKWGEGHIRVRLLRESLTELQDRLAEQQQKVEKQEQEAVEAFVDTARQEYELLDHKRNELQSSYDEQLKEAMEVSSQALQLVTLEESLKRTEKLCDILDDRMKEVNLSEEVGAMNVSIMEVAGASSKASYPSPSKFLALGTLLGGLTGFGLAWLRNLLDHRLRSIDEIANALQLPVLGVLPFQGSVSNRSHVGRVVSEQPRSTAAEAVRTLRTAMHFGLSDDGNVQTIAITSPSPGDGKSIVASNLAIAMAQAGQKVLLMDADLRKSRQHEIFEVESKHGLVSVLTERLPFDQAIRSGVVGTLDLIPCGEHPSNPVELLNNEYFAELLEELKKRYDKIIIDAPPVMPVADARVIAAQTDSVILVLRAERSTRRLSLAARNELWQVRAKRLGIVVNGVPSRKQGTYGYGYGYGYGGYNDYGYTAYGYGDDETPRGKQKSKLLRATETVAT